MSDSEDDNPNQYARLSKRVRQGSLDEDVDNQPQNKTPRNLQSNLPVLIPIDDHENASF